MTDKTLPLIPQPLLPQGAKGTRDFIAIAAEVRTKGIIKTKEVYSGETLAKAYSYDLWQKIIQAIELDGFKKSEASELQPAQDPLSAPPQFLPALPLGSEAPPEYPQNYRSYGDL